MTDARSIGEWVRLADKRRRLALDLIRQIEGQGYRDKHGHPIENNVAFKALRDATG